MRKEIVVREKPKTWSIGLFIAAALYIFCVEEFHMSYSIELTLAAIAVSFLIDGALGKIFEKRVYIE